QAVLHLLRDLRERKSKIVAWKGYTPDSISLRPNASVTSNDALAEKRTENTNQLVPPVLRSQLTRLTQSLNLTLQPLYRLSCGSKVHPAEGPQLLNGHLCVRLDVLDHWRGESGLILSIRSLVVC